jgi:hypothetical protein
MGRDRPRRPLKRRVANRTPRKTLLVFCEGTRTEPEYLAALKREPDVRDAAAVDIRIESSGGGAVPETLVCRAREAQRRASEEEGEIDEIWCVFDVEWPTNHPRLKEAVEEARQSGIHLAVSNPCFELWLVLHFQAQNAWLDNSDARKLRRKHDGSADKGLDGQVYMPHRGVAAGRAEALDRQHREADTAFPHNNPSSGMHQLLRSVSPDL